MSELRRNFLAEEMRTKMKQKGEEVMMLEEEEEEEVAIC